MQVAPGIHKVDGMRVGNAYLIVADDGLVLVDTGIRGNAKHVVRLIESLGRRPDELRTVVLTHWHIDHVGSAAAVKRLTGASVAIHELDGPILGGGELPRKGRRAMRLVVAVLRQRPLQPDVLLREGDRIGDFEVMHVPGHTDGSIALVREDGVIFSGDALLTTRTGEIRLPEPGLSVDPERAIASAERMKRLSLRLVLSGHGAPARVGPA